MSALPSIVEALVAVLLIASAVLSLVGAIGLVRLRNYFTRMHAPALASTGGVWCVAAATIVYFSAQGAEPALSAAIVAMLLAITAPISTLLLSRTGLFRSRRAGKDVPAAFGGNPAPLQEGSGAASAPARPTSK
jgi:multicomponent K+:H+ antiporter subunit G